jgi:GNAT superfamily N-acetyltransferase
VAARPTVSRAATADIPELVELMREFHAEADYPLDRAWAEASFRQLLGDSSRGAVWIARIADDPAGHAVLALRHSMEFGGLAGIIDDLFVRPGYRRQGIGAALVGAIFEECRGLGAAAVEVEVGQDNAAARELYLRFGLVPNDNGRRHLATRL